MKGFKKKCFLYRGHLKTSVKTSVKITTSYKQKYMYHKSVTKTLICIIFLLQNCKSVSFGPKKNSQSHKNYRMKKNPGFFNLQSTQKI